MKNKHIVLAFALLSGLVWLWNHSFRKKEVLSTDKKLAAEFLEKYHSATECRIDDGTEPSIRLMKDDHGWRVNFGALDATADEDSIKALFRAFSYATQSSTSITDALSQITLTLKTPGHEWQLKKVERSLFQLSTSQSNTKTLIQAPLDHWVLAPYEHWIFRKLQVKAPEEIQSLSYEWDLFDPMHLQKKDSLWLIPAQCKMNSNFLRDSLFPALGQLNRLEPALSFDPVGEAIKPFAQLHINDGKACTLQCYRLTEQQAEYYIQSSNVPQVYFKLPARLANTIFVRPRI